MFSLGGHTISYRSGCYDDGAFELCLPSLGILYQIQLLRDTILGRTPSMGWSWGEDHRPLYRVTLSHACRIGVAARILVY